MKKSAYKISYGPPLVVEDRPHREVKATRRDYGLPSLNEGTTDVSFSETHPAGEGVEISQPNIQEMEIVLN